jgi:hypothetical protein
MPKQILLRLESAGSNVAGSLHGVPFKNLIDSPFLIAIETFWGAPALNVVELTALLVSITTT